MKGKQKTPTTIDEYLAGYPRDVLDRLKLIREAILSAAPEAVQLISYRIPAFKLHGKVLIYFAAFQEHIGMYPAPRGVTEFQKDVAKYGAGKGTLRFPMEKPIPYGLIKRLVKYRAREIEQARKLKSVKNQAGRNQHPSGV